VSPSSRNNGSNPPRSTEGTPHINPCNQKDKNRTCDGYRFIATRSQARIFVGRPHERPQQQIRC